MAAGASFASFAIGAALPLLVAAVAGDARGWAVTIATIASLVGLGVAGAALGGASRWRGALRVGLGGAIALAVTFAVGGLLGTGVS